MRRPAFSLLAAATAAALVASERSVSVAAPRSAEAVRPVVAQVDAPDRQIENAADWTRAVVDVRRHESRSLRRRLSERAAASERRRARRRRRAGSDVVTSSGRRSHSRGSARARAIAPQVLANRHAHVVPIAKRYLGTPYRWAGASPSTGFDCSGLVMYVYAQVGISLPHNAALQYGYGRPVDRDDLEPGDLVFFNALGHNGIYIGNNQFVDAPKTGDVVKLENLDDPWWSASYLGARRLP